MKEFLKSILKIFSGHKVSLEEMYLDSAGSVEEVERRLREMERGEAPWQVAKRGW